MLQAIRSHAGTIAGGLAAGGAVGFGYSFILDLQHKDDDRKKPVTIDLESLRKQEKEQTARQIEAELNLPARTETSGGVDRLARWREKWSAGATSWQLTKPLPQLVEHLSTLLPEEAGTGKMVLFPLCGASADLGYLARRGHHVVGVDGVPQALDTLLKEYGEEIPSGGGLAPGETRLRVAQPAWWQKMAAEQMSKAAGRLPANDAPDGSSSSGSGGGAAAAAAATPPTSTLPPFEPAPFLFGVQGDFLTFDGAAAGKFGLGDFDAAVDRGGIVAVEPHDRVKYAANLAELLKPGGKLLLVAVEHEPSFGPPHSVDEAEVRGLFSRQFDVQCLRREDRLPIEPVWKSKGATRFDEVTYLCTRKDGR